MYALVDCNNFYCSCERVFNPKLEGRPVIVLSNNDGCAIARSEEAKALGIEMGTPEFLVREKLKAYNVAVFSSNYTLYDDMSDRVMTTLSGYVPKIELYSIDEAFLDMSELAYDDLLKLGLSMRRKVKQCIGIPVTVGIAPTKTLAKMANRFAKKKRKETGVFWAANKNLMDEMLDFTEVGSIWGIGHQYGQFLNTHGFKTASQFAKAPEEWVRKEMTVVGQRLWHELNGKTAIKWEYERPPKKNICTARSFGKLLSKKSEVKEALANYTASCAEKLRAQDSCATRIHVFLQTNKYRMEDKQYKASITVRLLVASNDTTELIKAANKGLDIIFRQKYNYQKCGVIVEGLVPHDQIQTSLFDDFDRIKRSTILKALDSTNKIFGKDVIRFAIQGFEKKYKLRAEYLSKRYTTNIQELPVLKN